MHAHTNKHASRGALHAGAGSGSGPRAALIFEKGWSISDPWEKRGMKELKRKCWLEHSWHWVRLYLPNNARHRCLPRTPHYRGTMMNCKLSMTSFSFVPASRQATSPSSFFGEPRNWLAETGGTESLSQSPVTLMGVFPLTSVDYGSDSKWLEPSVYSHLVTQIRKKQRKLGQPTKSNWLWRLAHGWNLLLRIQNHFQVWFSRGWHCLGPSVFPLSLFSLIVHTFL